MFVTICSSSSLLTCRQHPSEQSPTQGNFLIGASSADEIDQALPSFRRKRKEKKKDVASQQSLAKKRVVGVDQKWRPTPVDLTG
jgi:hypothetical protein